VFTAHPELSTGLFQSLSANYLASAGVRVYREILKEKIGLKMWIEAGFRNGQDRQFDDVLLF
jgi:hypothetical protein